MDALNSELQSATQFIAGERRIDPFSVDPDASRKRKLSRLAALSGDLASVGRLPDYRYVVTSGEMDPGRLDTMRRQMPHFLSGYQISVDEEPVKP